ncbi:MAG: hypothetical protein AAGJ94_13240 [Pseudomonadota bacterium]
MADAEPQDAYMSFLPGTYQDWNSADQSADFVIGDDTDTNQASNGSSTAAFRIGHTMVSSTNHSASSAPEDNASVDDSIMTGENFYTSSIDVDFLS